LKEYLVCIWTTVRTEAVDESVSVDVSVASSTTSSGNAGSGGSLASRVLRRSLGWSMMRITKQADDDHQSPSSQTLQSLCITIITAAFSLVGLPSLP
jgi:hypothetical protein